MIAGVLNNIGPRHKNAALNNQTGDDGNNDLVFDQYLAPTHTFHTSTSYRTDMTPLKL